MNNPVAAARDYNKQVIPLRAAYIKALLDGDTLAAPRVVDSAIRLGLNAHNLYDDILIPCLIELGDLWHSDRISIAQEHLATQITINQMARLRLQVTPKEKLNLRCVVAAVQGDAHVIGAQIVSDYLLWDGWNVDFLGSDTPAADLAQFCEERKCDLLCLSVTLPQHIEQIKKASSALAKLKKRPKLLVGGAALTNNKKTLKELGADAIVTDARLATQEARRLFNLDRPLPVLNSYLKRLGECIKNSRKLRELSQQELALRCSLDRAYLSSVENGKQNITIAALVRIAQALGLQLEDLLTADQLKISEILGQSIVSGK